MAGDVTASVDANGTLSLKGDAQSNQVQVVQYLNHDGTPDPGHFILMQSDTSTTINGSSSRSFTGVKNILIDLGDGDDHVTVGDGNVNHFSLPGMLGIYKGNGNDSITLNRITVSGSMEIDTDGRRIDGTRTDINPGNNTIDVAGYFNGGTSSGGYGIINLGNGNDSVFVHDATFSNLDITSYRFNANFDGTLMTGDKAIDLHYVTVSSLSINTGTGNDSVTLDHLTQTGVMFILTGDGADTVTLNSSNVNEPEVRLGSGNDSIHLNGVQGRKVDVDGGDGYDQYFESLGTHFTYGKTLVGFDLPLLKLNPYSGW
jgi:hypothetical protein